MNWDEIEICLDGNLTCPRCHGTLLFAARVPVTVDWVHGQSVTAHRTVTLCPHCHRDDPAAQGLLAFFTLHERITSNTVASAGELIHEWITVASATTYTDADLEDDIRHWEAGEM